MTDAEGLMADTGPSVTATDARTIAARLDRLPVLTRKHVVLMIVLISMFIFDLIDLSSFAFVAPALSVEWNLTVEELGLLTSTAFAGMFIGGVIGGRLADRLGRKPMILLGVALFSLASLASAAAPTPEALGALRLLTGFGIQMATGSILVMVSETFPKPFRGRAIAIILGVSALGAPLIALVARIFVPMGMWHVVFVVGSLGLIPALFAVKLLPESPRWLAVKGRLEQADAEVRIYEAQATQRSGPLPELLFDTATPSLGKASGILDIFRTNLLARTIVGTLLFSTWVLANYGFAAWFPTILVQRGFSQADALNIALVASLGVVAGALCAALVIDRLERKIVMITCGIMLTFCYLAVGFVDSVPVLLIAGFLVNLLVAAVASAIFAYVPEMFPIAVRGIGAGFTNGVGRIAGTLSGIIIAAVISYFNVQAVFVYLALIAVAMAVVASFGPVTGIRSAHKALLAEKALTKQDNANTLPDGGLGLRG